MFFLPRTGSARRRPIAPALAAGVLIAGVLAAGVLVAGVLTAGALDAQTPPRARDLGIPFPGEPGSWNAITDVAGIRVGHATIIEGEGALVVGEGPVRTGVT
ncbi:MAG: hypothetical protein F4Y74_08760, partial [Gemmatimonadales bacterium]|nr:hypothetical protein [Gemmatimonadales bacterium]